MLVCRQFHSEASQLVKATMLITSTHYTILTTNLPLEKISELGDLVLVRSARYGKLGAAKSLTLITTLDSECPRLLNQLANDIKATLTPPSINDTMAAASVRCPLRFARVFDATDRSVAQHTVVMCFRIKNGRRGVARIHH